MAARKYVRSRGSKKKRPGGAGKSATAPGHLKRAAGSTSAKSFARSRTGVPSAARPVPGTPPSAGPSTPQRPSRPMPPSVGSGDYSRERGAALAERFGGRKPRIDPAGPHPRSYPGGAGDGATARPRGGTVRVPPGQPGPRPRGGKVRVPGSASASSPGHLKKAAGAQSARAFAPGHTKRTAPTGSGASATGGAKMSLQPVGTPKPYGQKGRPRRRTA